MTEYGGKIALLSGIIDYAGTFPPAALPLEKALESANIFRQKGRHPWLMGKVAYPLEVIRTFSPKMLYAHGADGTPWIFTALGGKPEGDQFADFAKTVEWELREISRWNERSSFSSLRAQIVAYEIKLPKQWEGIESLLDRLTHLEFRNIDVFFEIDPEDVSSGEYVRFFETLAEWVGEQERGGLIPGAKLRTGGKIPPTAEEIARFVVETVGCGLRFKATQGLHSAVTHGEHFGFVNLFATIALSQALGREEFGVKQATQCLKDEAKNSFVFSPSGFKWREYTLTNEEMESARRRHHASFGSCSVDEPDESLAKEF